MKRQIKNFLVGSDIEVFVIDTVTNTVISAEGLIGGTKKAPKPLERPGCAVQEDNVMAEFNVPPTTDPEEMYENIVFVLNKITNSLPEGLDIAILPAAKLDAKYLETEQAREIGCDPDFNAWTGLRNIPPDVETLDGLRSCGGHIHIGYENPTKSMSIRLIKALDLYLTVGSIIKDRDILRRQIYGKAGAYRIKPYGVELRTLSNFWIKSKEDVKWIFNNIEKAINFVNSGQKISDDLAYAITKAINQSDVRLATLIANEYKLFDTEIPVPEEATSELLTV